MYSDVKSDAITTRFRVATSRLRIVLMLLRYIMYPVPNQKLIQYFDDSCIKIRCF